MGAARYTLRIEQGATWQPVLTLRDTNLTGYTARMQARTNVADVDTLLDLSTENGKIAIDGPAGQITLTLTSGETAALTWQQAYYDLEIIAPDGDVTRLLKGIIEVDAEVTR